MKKSIEIIPLKGVKMDNLDIDLGNDMKSIINILGKPNIQEENGLMVKCTPERGHNALFFIPLQVFIML